VTHQRQQIVFRIAKGTNPEIITTHVGDKDRLFFKDDAALGERRISHQNVNVGRPLKLSSQDGS